MIGRASGRFFVTSGSYPGSSDNFSAGTPRRRRAVAALLTVRREGVELVEAAAEADPAVTRAATVSGPMSTAASGWASATGFSRCSDQARSTNPHYQQHRVCGYY